VKYITVEKMCSESFNLVPRLQHTVYSGCLEGLRSLVSLNGVGPRHFTKHKNLLRQCSDSTGVSRGEEEGITQ
jgi:hypothetical protein